MAGAEMVRSVPVRRLLCLSTGPDCAVRERCYEWMLALSVTVEVNVESAADP